MHLAPNDLLQGRYRVQSLIAQGGMGAVYRAVDERLGNTVALKQTLMSDPQLRAAFEREARLLAGLHHPALPVVSDHFTEGEGQFLVMQYIPGDDLASMLASRGGPFPLAEVLPWADRLLDALDFLHTQRPPVIHRDLKPQNLKLTPRGEIVLLDFGLAKGELGSGGATGGRSLFGYTPQYAPLEQIQGTGTDPRSDLYSFGATIYQLLTGETPPDALTRASALVAGQPDPLRPAHLLRPQLPAALGDLLQLTMAQSAAQRPASAADLRRALQHAAAGASSFPQTLIAAGQAGSAGQPTINMARPGAAPTVQSHPAAPAAAGPSAVKWRLIGGAAALSVGVLVAAVFFLLQLFMGGAVGGQDTSATAMSALKPTPVMISATAGAAPELGAGVSRADPLPAGATAQIASWAVLVTGVTRGDDAWNLLYETNSNNKRPPEGQEYLVVHVRARALAGSEANRELYPRLTGDRLILYSPVAAVTPKQRPEEYAAESEHDIDFPYLVALGEGDLILNVDDLASSDTQPIFVAIDEGAAITVDPALRSIKPTSLGADPREPAGIGETVTTEDYEVTVREVLRGDAAYQRLIEANRYNDPPKDGTEYLLALVEVRFIGAKDELVMVSDSNFYSAVGDAQDVEATAIKYTSVVEPEPDMPFYLYPGGQSAGWVAVAIPKDTPSALLVFGPSFGSSDLNTRYFAIE
ncbi:protein kinase [Oscillochloris sp. ZM17-4]|uniref:serine/threonine-protein kinase n=1 Tax=Oscillochloris sp. ZM17-4 TaxID=2866714 RepID=UPI001C72B2DF|nr:serine/threonine-protein kinase [Oscillochloris sp. ZM17-4]MBX0329313.1 protein kinase [Oscillochloris sp. ZM17-4]